MKPLSGGIVSDDGDATLTRPALAESFALMIAKEFKLPDDLCALNIIHA
jgi:hypothetical protein